MNISQDLLKMSCFHDYAHLTDLFLGIQMGLQVCFSVEGEDNENNICCGVSCKFKIFFSHPVKDQQIVLMLMMVLRAVSSADGFRVGTLEDMSHILLFLLLVCQGLCVVLPPGWSWRQEEWDSRREKVEEEKEKLGRGKEKHPGFTFTQSLLQVEEGSG